MKFSNITFRLYKVAAETVKVAEPVRVIFGKSIFKNMIYDPSTKVMLKPARS